MNPNGEVCDVQEVYYHKRSSGSTFRDARFRVEMGEIRENSGDAHTRRPLQDPCENSRRMDDIPKQGKPDRPRGSELLELFQCRRGGGPALPHVRRIPVTDPALLGASNPSSRDRTPPDPLQKILCTVRVQARGVAGGQGRFNDC